MRQRGDGRGRSLSFPWFWVGTDLKRLLQYLHGSVLGFWCRVSPFSSALLDGGDASIDCSGSIAHEKKRVCWGGQDSWGIGTHGGGTVTVQDTGQRRRSHLAPLGEWGKGEGGGVGGGEDRQPNTAEHCIAGWCRWETKWPNQGAEPMPARVPVRLFGFVGVVDLPRPRRRGIGRRSEVFVPLFAARPHLAAHIHTDSPAHSATVMHLLAGW